MPDHLDFGRHDVQLFGGHLADLSQHSTVMGTDPVLSAQLVNDINTRQGLRQFFATPFLTGVCRNSNLFIFWFCFGVRFGFIEQTVLIPGIPFHCWQHSAGPGQIELFLEGKNS